MRWDPRSPQGRWVRPSRSRSHAIEWDCRLGCAPPGGAGLQDNAGVSPKFDDRLDAATYADDVHVGVYERDPSESDSLWLSERLFARLVLIAKAYELRTLSWLGGADPVRLGRSQCEDLLDEVAFVANRVDDRLLVDLCQAVDAYLSTRLRATPASAVTVTFEGN